MKEERPVWRCIGPDARWCAQLEPLLPALGTDLELDRDFRLITLFADDAPGEDSCWFRMLSPAGGDADGRDLELYFSARALGKPRPLRNTIIPGPEIWDAREGAWNGGDFDPLDFSVFRVKIFLYHHILLARDLARGEFSPQAIPAGQVEAFEAAWEVGVDGRLARAGLPGFTLAERRGQFSRLFSAAGVLMPGHWQVFQALWDGGLATGRDVLSVLRRLPRL